MSARYLTTTLPYVNASPHLGHALEFVQADALVRIWRAKGEEVFFNTGADEHGQKIFEAAKKAGQDVQAYSDRYAAELRKLADVLNLDHPAFIRTTDPAHIAAAQEIWRRCKAKGDIYKKEYEGLYCVGHEAFLKEKDLIDGKCPEHDSVPQLLREDNYFFKFKNYEQPLREYLGRSGVIMPEWRRIEALNFVNGGLEDFSISREKERLSWGIPVPDDDSQVMYVWFDALTSYISTLGWPNESGDFKKFWLDGHTLQMAGKDQIRFQSLMWQAMLMSADIKNTDTVFYHGFINSGGRKMSKSLGNVISPYDLVKKYGTDATRYILLRHIHATDDSDVTWERLDEWYTAHLANGLGNLVARVMKLAEDNNVPLIRTNISDPATQLIERVTDSFEFNEAMNVIWQKIQTIDRHINEQEPYKVVKTNPAQGKALIQNFVRNVFEVGTLLEPFMPDTSKGILVAIQANKKPGNLFPRL